MQSNVKARRAFCGLVLTLLATAGCHQEIAAVNTAVSPVDSLAAASPASVGLDPERLDRLVGRIRSGEYREIHSLLVLRHGKLVLEEYFNGWPPDSIHTQQSVTKSFASALGGIGIERGVFRDVDERVVDFFPQWADSLDGDPRRGRITIEDILTMRTGTNYEEGYAGSPHD